METATQVVAKEGLPPEIAAELGFMQWLKDNGHFSPRPIGGGRYAAVLPLIYTHAIIVGSIGNRSGYDDRWCYERGKALAALDAWDGQGDPPVGWHRHPRSGRRRPDGDPGREHVLP